jgi:flagellin
MALTILNNIAALAAQNQLNITSNNLTSTLEQLSSGSRINSGADDPAGLAIANGLEANIAALTQSASNATDGVGELQVADGALSQVTTLLNRAVTLATESATGTVSNSQRAALDSEYQSIKAEIDSIGSTTNFNGGQVFTTDTLDVFLSDGSTSGSSTIGVSTGLLSSSSLNLGGATAATAALTQAAGTAAIAATNSLTGGAFLESAVAAATLTAGAGPANNDTVTLNGQIYTFKTALTGAANEVALGGSETAALANLASAVNASPGGAGTAYGNGTLANTGLKATASTGTSITFNALANGVGGNSLAYSSSGANFGAAGTLAGGTAGSTVAVGGKTYTFVAALSTTPTVNEVVASDEATGLTNLALAVNQGAGAGTVYGTGTTQNANVTAGTATGTTLLFTANTAGSAGNFITGAASVGSFGTLDFAGGANTGAAPIAAAGDTVSIGGQQYTFVSALSTTPVANQVLVESTEAASLTNLANAVNGGTGSGATYSSNTITTPTPPRLPRQPP